MKLRKFFDQNQALTTEDDDFFVPFYFSVYYNEEQ